MLDSLYGDLPPPTKAGEGTSPPASGGGSLLGSLYDDTDDVADSASPSASSGTAPAPAPSVSGSGTSAAPDSTTAAWAAQRLKLLTPAVLRRQTLPKTSTASAATPAKPSPSLNVQAAAADTAAMLQRLKQLQQQQARSPPPAGGFGISPTTCKSGGTPLVPSVPGNSANLQVEPVVNILSVTVGGGVTAAETDGGWVPIGLLAGEYDPSKPNDYSSIHREKMRQQQREEIERLKQIELDKQRMERELAKAGENSNEATSPEAQPAVIMPSYIGDSGKKTFAARMMEKMGWKQGEGLGANKQGITAPLVARKTAMRSGIIVQGQDVSTLGTAPKTVTFNMAPTRILLLLNMVGRGQVDADLKSETEEEAAKIGNLLQVKIFEAAGVPDDVAVRIFCEYERKEEAARALLTFQGRVFGGRTVKAKFYSEERFAKGDLRPDPEKEVDQNVTVTM